MHDDGDPVREFSGVKNLLLFIADALHAGQDVLFVGNTGKAGLVEQHFGENYGRHLVAHQRGVDRQLRLGNPGIGPVFNVDRRPRLVIDDDLPAVGQLIDAVDNHFDANFLDLDFRRFLAGDHLEIQSTPAFNGQPDHQQLAQARRLQFAKTGRQRQTVIQFISLQRLADRLGDHLLAGRLSQRRQRLRTAHRSPERLQRLMHQRATGGGIEAFDRLIHRLATEPELVVSPGRTDCLGAEQPTAAGNLFALTDRGRQRIGKLFAG